MNIRLILFFVCVISAAVGLMETVSGIVGILCHDAPDDVRILMACAAATIIVGTTGYLVFRPRTEQHRKAGLREGYAVAAFGWLAASFLGGLPFLFVAKMPWYDAFFESVSGFTTTGAALIHKGYVMTNGAVLTNGVESMPRGIVFWRALETWLGGMGIVVLALAVLPMFNRGVQMLYNAETPGLKSSDTQIAPRITSSAKILWMIYVGITVCEVVLLRFAGMNLFESVCNSFTTISTGGFCTRQDSIAAFQSTPITLIVTFFMFISGINFFLHVRFLSGRPLSYFRDEEFRVYTSILAGVSCIIAIALLFQEDAYHIGDEQGFLASMTVVGEAFRDATFQVTSFMTSTGFTSVLEWSSWPPIAVALLVGISVIGGCGGSTAGGLKCVRALLVWRQSLTEIKHNIFPQLVTGVYLNNIRMKAPAIQKTIAFFTAYIGVIIIFALLIPLVCPKCTWETGLSASITCLSNVGPGFGGISSSLGFDWLNPEAKLLSAFEMLIGRLELFTILVLFLPSFWRK
jgi:trk system potassium uptake protein TrkH